MNDNRKIRAPKLAITKPMVDAGKDLMAKMLDDVESHSDDALVAGIFFRMWEVYWEEIEGVRRQKEASKLKGSPLIIATERMAQFDIGHGAIENICGKPKLILP